MNYTEYGGGRYMLGNIGRTAVGGGGGGGGGGGSSHSGVS